MHACALFWGGTGGVLIVKRVCTKQNIGCKYTDTWFGGNRSGSERVQHMPPAW